jgi:hypothetical protein
MVLVGGTASIRGEDSVHPGSLLEQTQETFDNLACLIHAAAATSATTSLSPLETARWLQPFRQLRIYYVRGGDLPLLQEQVQAAFPAECEAEFTLADLCRKELLVEIEGVAAMPHLASAVSVV